MRVLLFGLLFIVSCNSSPTKRSESFILQDIEQHLTASSIVQKSILSNEKKENITDTITDWKKEFHLFLSYIPSKEILESDYQITENQTAQGISKKYIAQEKHALKELEITHDINGNARSYYAHVIESNGLNYADYHLYWDIPKQEYKIIAKEGISHSREVRYEVIGKVLN